MLFSVCTKTRVWRWCRRQAPSCLRQHLSKQRRHSYELALSPSSSVLDATITAEADEASDAYDEYKCEPQLHSPVSDMGDMSRRKTWSSYGYTAATMIPAIFVLVPSGIAAMGSLLVGTITANSVTQGPKGATTKEAGGTLNRMVQSSVTADGAIGIISVILDFLQVALGVSFGLCLGVMLCRCLCGSKKHRNRSVSSF
jgi:hypothetical protein